MRHAYTMTTTRIASCKSTYNILTTDAHNTKNWYVVVFKTCLKTHDNRSLIQCYIMRVVYNFYLTQAARAAKKSHVIKLYRVNRPLEVHTKLFLSAYFSSVYYKSIKRLSPKRYNIITLTVVIFDSNTLSQTYESHSVTLKVMLHGTSGNNLRKIRVFALQVFEADSKTRIAKNCEEKSSAHSCCANDRRCESSHVTSLLYGNGSSPPPHPEVVTFALLLISITGREAMCLAY